MRDWQAKVDAFSAKVANKGAQAGTATENGLQKAWAKTQAEAQRLAIRQRGRLERRQELLRGKRPATCPMRGTR